MGSNLGDTLRALLRIGSGGQSGQADHLVAGPDEQEQDQAWPDGGDPTSVASTSISSSRSSAAVSDRPALRAASRTEFSASAAPPELEIAHVGAKSDLVGGPRGVPAGESPDELRPLTCGVGPRSDRRRPRRPCSRSRFAPLSHPARSHLIGDTVHRRSAGCATDAAGPGSSRERPPVTLRIPARRDETWGPRGRVAADFAAAAAMFRQWWRQIVGVLAALVVGGMAVSEDGVTCPGGGRRDVSLGPAG